MAQGPARLLGLRRLPARRAHAGARRRRQRHRAVLHGEPHPHHEGAVLPVRAVGNGGHRGRALLRAQRRRHQGHPARRRGPAVRRLGRRLHHHPAARAQHGALRRAVRADAVAQGARGLHRHTARADVLQRRHPHDVPQLHLLWSGLLRHRGRGADVLRQVLRGPHHRRGGHAGGPAPVALLLQPARKPRKRHRAPQRRACPPARQGPHHPAGIRRRRRERPRAQLHAPREIGRLRLPVLRGLREVDALHAVLHRRHLQGRSHRQDHHLAQVSDGCRERRVERAAVRRRRA